MSKVLFVSYILVGFLLFSQGHATVPKIGVYKLKKGDFQLKITNYGATIMSVKLPDKHGNVADVVLGFDSVDEYKNDTTYFGALVGRVANRIANAQFSLDGNIYKLPANDGKNTLHGGPKGFSTVIWTVESYQKDSHITFAYVSADNEEGFPGKLEVSVTYMFIKSDMLGVKMSAKAVDHDTPVNLAQHTYWNLRGHNSGDILSHHVQIFGSNITPVNKNLIPTGKITSVKGTPYDFLQLKTVGSQIHELPDGYDINYVLDKSTAEHLRKVAVVHDPQSGRKLELWSNQPGVQFYTSNILKDVKGKNGAVYRKFAALCLETQDFPDSVNHPNFPSMIVKAGEEYKHYMVYRFTANAM